MTNAWLPALTDPPRPDQYAYVSAVGLGPGHSRDGHAGDAPGIGCVRRHTGTLSRRREGGSDQTHHDRYGTRSTGNEVRVCVSGLSDAKPSEDLIAAFAPADAPFNATAPIKVGGSRSARTYRRVCICTLTL